MIVLKRHNLRQLVILARQWIRNNRQSIVPPQLHGVGIDTIDKARDLAIYGFVRLKRFWQLLSGNKRWILKVNLTIDPRFPSLSRVNNEILAMPFLFLSL
jgi:hypothetical protein